MNARDKATYDYYHPNEKNSAPTPTTRLEPLAVSHESPPTEQQQQNDDLGRRPMFVETADHSLNEGYTIHQRTWRIGNPFDREREPVKYWLFWIGSGIVFVVVTVVPLRFILPM